MDVGTVIGEEIGKDRKKTKIERGVIRGRKERKGIKDNYINNKVKEEKCGRVAE